MEDNNNGYKPIGSIAEFMQSTTERKPAWIDHIVPQEPGEIVLIAAPPGIGKTNVALSMGFALSNGSDFLSFGCHRANTVYLALEGPEDNLRNRIRKIWHMYEEPELLRYSREEPFKLGTEQGFHKFCSRCQKADVILIDNLKQIAPPDYLKPEGAKRFCDVLRKALRSIGAVGILTCHVAKHGGDLRYRLDPDDVFNIKGAADYAEEASTVITMDYERKAKDNRGKFSPQNKANINLYFAKARISTVQLPPLYLRWDYERGIFNFRDIDQVRALEAYK